MLRKLLNNILTEATVLDSLIHSSENSCSICDALLLSDLGACGIQIGRTHSQIMSCHFKGTACSCACFFKNQGNILTSVILMKLSCFFLCLQICCKVDHVSDLFRCKVFQCQEISSFKIHNMSSSRLQIYFCSAGLSVMISFRDVASPAMPCISDGMMIFVALPSATFCMASSALSLST